MGKLYRTHMSQLVFMLFMVTVIIPGCTTSQLTKERQCFVKQIITKLGKNGQACSERDGLTYCVSADLNSAKPITIGDELKPDQELWLCLQSNGSLTECKPTTSFDIHCGGEPGAGGGCRCRGIDSCIKMAEKKGCENGSCGNCTGADCCCEF